MYSTIHNRLNFYCESHDSIRLFFHWRLSDAHFILFHHKFIEASVQIGCPFLSHCFYSDQKMLASWSCRCREYHFEIAFLIHNNNECKWHWSPCDLKIAIDRIFPLSIHICYIFTDIYIEKCREVPIFVEPPVCNNYKRMIFSNQFIYSTILLSHYPVFLSSYSFFFCAYVFAVATPCDRKLTMCMRHVSSRSDLLNFDRSKPFENSENRPMRIVILCSRCINTHFP